MTGIRFDDDLQPVLNSTKDFDEVDGKEKLEQIIRFKALDRLYSLLSEYDEEEVPNKLKMEISRIASNSELIDEVAAITIETNDGGTTYDVTIRYEKASDFQFQLTQL